VFCPYELPAHLFEIEKPGSQDKHGDTQEVGDEKF
jgi:hypothetical protein